MAIIKRVEEQATVTNIIWNDITSSLELKYCRWDVFDVMGWLNVITADSWNIIQVLYSFMIQQFIWVISG